MYGKVFIVLLFFITSSNGQLCPDSTGAAAVNCTLVPGCNYDNGTLTALATQCSNEMDDSDCESLFPCTASSSGATCNQTLNSGTSGDPSTYPYVRAPACTNANLQNIALQCKYIKVIYDLYMDL